MKIFGGLQIALGFICVILSIVGVALSSNEMNKPCYSNNYNSYYGYYYYRQCFNGTFGFIAHMICLFFSGWVGKSIFHESKSIRFEA